MDHCCDDDTTLREILERLLCLRHHCHPRVSLTWTIGPVSEQPMISGPPEPPPMLQLTSSQQCDLSIQPVDKKGKPAKVEAGSVAWSSSDSAVATVTADPSDELKALVVAVDLGTAQINVSADADLGEGVTTISGQLDVTIVAGQAVGIGIQTGTPTEQPETPPQPPTPQPMSPRRR